MNRLIRKRPKNQRWKMAPESKHTKGDWTTREGHPSIVASPDGGTVAVVNRYNVSGELKPDEEVEANGILLAAAPKLLEACEHALELLEEWSSCPNPFIENELRPAIAKAKGEGQDD